MRHIGEGFRINLLAGSAMYLEEVDADRWKSWVHQRLATPMGQPGAMSEITFLLLSGTFPFQ